MTFNPLQHPICLGQPRWLVPPSAWAEHIPFGMLVIDALRPALLVELGTHTGNSYCGFCQAVEELHLDTRCFAVDTWKGDPHSGTYGPDVFFALEAYHDQLYASFSTLLRATFDDAVSQFKSGSIDLLHIDGYHTYEAVRHDFETWLPTLSGRGVVLLHDTQVRERDFGVWKLWSELRDRFPSFEFEHGFGLGVLKVGSAPVPALDPLFSANVRETERIRRFFSRLGARVHGPPGSGQATRRLLDPRTTLDPSRGASAPAPLPQLARASLAVDASDAPSVSIVIPNFNGIDHLETCILSLQGLAYPVEQRDIILVDNASTDGSVEMLQARFPDVRVLRNTTNTGFSKAANQGVAASSAQFVAFLNTDMRVDPNWLKELLEPLHTNSAVACAGSLILTWDGSAVDYFGRPDDLFALKVPADPAPAPEPGADAPVQTMFASGGAMLIRRKLFEEVGGFDPGYFMYHEDVDLGWRLRLLGHEVVLCPRSVVFHRGSASASELDSEFIIRCQLKNVLATVFRNFDEVHLQRALPLLLYYLLERGRRYHLARLPLAAAISDFTASLPELIDQRSRIQSSRRTADDRIFSQVRHPLAFLLDQPAYKAIQADILAANSSINFDPRDPPAVKQVLGAWLNTAHFLHEERLIAEINQIRSYEIPSLAGTVREVKDSLRDLARGAARQEEESRALSAQLAERNRRIAMLSTRATDQEQGLLQLRAENDNLRFQLSSSAEHLHHATSYLAELQSGLAFRVLSAYRRGLERLLPPSSWGRRAYDLTLKAQLVLIEEGPGGLLRRLRARGSLASPPERQLPLTQASSGPGPTPGTTAPLASAPSTVSSWDTLVPEDRYQASYSALLATATTVDSPEFVGPSAEFVRSADLPLKLIAFYLPQFHPIPENDEWWGRGFTEWTNVSKAVPQFVGHYQPRLPGELGFYDLRVKEVQRRQVELARQYGIYGFCIHYYWFNGKRLLQHPLDQLVDMPGNDMPFCLCWANENWTRRWDGREEDVLIAQVHSRESDLAFVHDVIPYFRRENYIRIDGRPVLVVYRLPLMPDPRATTERWRQACRQAGVGEPYLIAAQTFGFLDDPRKHGFDAAVEFPPHDIRTPKLNRSVQMLNHGFAGEVHDYADAVAFMMQRPTGRYPLFKSVFPAWDNEARKPGRGHIFSHSTPGAYRDWLVAAGRVAMANPDPGQRLVFINAWNEWGEGAYLEPDRRYGYAYLQATADALKMLSAEGQAQPTSAAAATPHGAPTSSPQETTPPPPWASLTTRADANVSLDPVIVYQMGKVGSRSVVFSLEITYRMLDLPVEVFHVHNLNDLDSIEAVVRTRPNPAETLEAIGRDRLLRERIDSVGEQRWRLISLVREPVSRNIAWFFQNLHELMPDWQARLSANSLPLQELQELFLDTAQGTHDTAERWFDEQMKPVFGIDVYEQPFPTQAGFQRLSNPPRFELLLIRTEDLSASGPRAIDDFLGLRDFTLVDRNVSKDKPYAALYRDFLRLPLPRSYTEELYSGRYARHFYSPAEIKEFVRRWTAQEARA